MSKKLIAVMCVTASALLLGGCATNIKASTNSNPPPTEKFSNFSHIEIKPAQLSPEMAGDSANQRALIKIQENLDLNLKAQLQQWNSGKAGTGRTLVIEPIVEQIKFISGGVRFFAGPMAGSSAVVMKLKIMDTAGNKVVAYPEFYQRAEAWSGAFTLGVHDNMMLTRTARIASDYLINNYTKAVGGPTGGNVSE
ncbi:MAG: hypothetical protein P4L87_04450 [Formivibrio sp.]|nr:hypothetical protein [Formivibrio sp.]